MDSKLQGKIFGIDPLFFSCHSPNLGTNVKILTPKNKTHICSVICDKFQVSGNFLGFCVGFCSLKWVIKVIPPHSSESPSIRMKPAPEWNYDFQLKIYDVTVGPPPIIQLNSTTLLWSQMSPHSGIKILIYMRFIQSRWQHYHYSPSHV